MVGGLKMSTVIAICGTVITLYIVVYVVCRKLSKDDKLREAEEREASIEYSKHCNDSCKYCNISRQCLKLKNTQRVK